MPSIWLYRLYTSLHCLKGTVRGQRMTTTAMAIDKRQTNNVI